MKEQIDTLQQEIMEAVGGEQFFVDLLQEVENRDSE